jgi:hypothetical protein
MQRRRFVQVQIEAGFAGLRDFGAGVSPSVKVPFPRAFVKTITYASVNFV